MGRRLLRFVGKLAVLVACAALVGGGIGWAAGRPVADFLGAGHGSHGTTGPPAATHSSGPQSAPPHAGAARSGHPSPSPSESPEGPLEVNGARPYDPLGDGHEHDELAHLAVDGNPATAWHTEHYGSAGIGGLKKGVGLLVDLGHLRTVTAVHIRLLDGGGATLQLRAGSTAESLADLPVVATVHEAETTHTAHFADGKKTRYWLVWFTHLPPRHGTHRAGVSDIEFTGR